MRLFGLGALVLFHRSETLWLGIVFGILFIVGDGAILQTPRCLPLALGARCKRFSLGASHDGIGRDGKLVGHRALEHLATE